jgi:hypothetical protein
MKTNKVAIDTLDLTDRNVLRTRLIVSPLFEFIIGTPFSIIALDRIMKALICSPKMVRIPIIVRSKIARTKLVLNPSKKGVRVMDQMRSIREQPARYRAPLRAAGLDPRLRLQSRVSVRSAQQPIAIAGSNGLPVFRTPKHATNSLRIAANDNLLGLEAPLPRSTRRCLFASRPNNQGDPPALPGWQ